MTKNGGLPSCHAKKSREENWMRKKLTDGWSEDIEDQILKLGFEYKQYRVELEEKRLAKEERKRIREEKKAKK